MTEPVIRLEGVRFAYSGGGPVLAGVELVVEPGEFVLIVGASGSGKSTLLRCLNGLIPHFHSGRFEGRAIVAGRDVREHPPAIMFDRVGFVPQNPAGALFAPTVADEIAYGLESLGIAPDQIMPRAEAAASSVGLSNRLLRAPHTLSGGEMQRLLVATALAVRPAVLALDEPFANLDPEMAEELTEILARLVAAGVTVVLCEHRLGPVLPHASRLVVMEGGRVVADGVPQRVVDRDLLAHGVNLPLPVRLGQASGLVPPPLTLESLLGRLPAGGGIPGLEPARPRMPLDGQEAVALEGVTTVVDGEALLLDLDVTMGDGETVALLGRNGAGKTSLLKHLNGLLRPSHGVVRIHGSPIRRRPVSALAHEVGFVFQNPNDQFFQPTVRDELETVPRALGARDAVWLDALVERFSLGPLLDRSPFRLSEGEKKRVTFAAALAGRPRIVLLDEPTTGQDERFRCELVDLVRELAQREATVILATHDVELADDTAGRWLVLDEGTLVSDGAPDDVMRDVAAFRAAGLRPAGASWAREVLSIGRQMS